MVIGVPKSNVYWWIYDRDHLNTGVLLGGLRRVAAGERGGHHALIS